MLALTREESYFDPLAQSAAGASGLMQLMPATAGEINNKFKQIKVDGNSFPANASLNIGKNGIDVTLTDSIGGSQTDIQNLLTKVSQNIIIASLKDNNVQDDIFLIHFHDSSNNLIGNANTTDGSFTLNHYGRKLYQ